MNEHSVLNTIPMRTWKWLKVNDTTLKGELPAPRAYRAEPIKAENGSASATILPLMFASAWPFAAKAPVRMGADWERFVDEQANLLYDVTLHSDEPLHLNLAMDSENPYLVDDMTMVVERAEKGTVVLSYTGDGWHAGRTRMLIRSKAQAKIVILQNLANTAVHTSALSVAVEDDAKVEIVCIDFGAAEAITNINVEMWGCRSDVSLHSLYLGMGEQKLDINYRMALHGRENRAEMVTHGVLLDRCRKIYRGTLDFLSGCAGSKGNERENTILLSKDARHLSVPILLCGEDDVEGAHAASTGKMDENQLFYLMSRGLTENEARKLIIEVAFAPVLAKIGDDEIESQLMEYVRGKLDHVESIS